MKKVRELKSWIEGYEQVTSAVGDLQVLFDFAKEGEATEEEVDAQYQETIRVLEDIEMRNMLRISMSSSTRMVSWYWASTSSSVASPSLAKSKSTCKSPTAEVTCS